MSQTRLFITLAEPEASRAFAALESAFEEEGFPIDMAERDEKAALFEISVYADGDPGLAEARMRSAIGPQAADASIGRETLADIDWVSHSLQGLAPVRAGRFVVHGAHDRDARRANEIAVEIDAGQAFGTGHHGTTAGCLEMIAAVARRERPGSALDLGTGSAVLAIGLAKLCRIPVLATDIDPLAVRVARENVRLNGVAGLVEVVAATGFRHRRIADDGPYALIVANILAGPLMRLAPEMAAHLAHGGSLILSGILERQRRAVVAAYAVQRFRHVHTIRHGEWVTLHLKR